MNQNVKDRFLTYVSFDTQSDSSSSTVPSTEKQLKLAAYLADELKGLGLHDVEMDQYACVYAHIPASAGCARPGLALIAHMDTNSWRPWPFCPPVHRLGQGSPM